MRLNWLSAVGWFLLGVLLIGAPMLAFAETIPAGLSHLWRAERPPYAVGSYGDVCAADCTALLAQVGQYTFVSCVSSEPATGVDSWLAMNQLRNGVESYGGACDLVHRQPGGACPVGQDWTLSGSNCTRPDCSPTEARDPADGICKSNACPSGETRDGGGVCQCNAPGHRRTDGQCGDCPEGDTIHQGTPYSGAGDMPDKLCIAGCKYHRQGLGIGVGSGASGFWYADAGKKTGEDCFATATAPDGDAKKPVTEAAKNSPEASCVAAGKGYGTVNGVVLCVEPTTTQGEKVKTVTQKDVNGGVTSQETTTTETTSTNSEGVVTRTTTVTKPDGSKTITSTTGPSGTAAGAGGGSGGGSGAGGGACDPATQKCQGLGDGDLYGKKTKTFDDVLTAFSNSIKTSAIGTASTGFFTVSVGGGGCPSWSGNIDFMGTSVPVNIGEIFCSPGAESMLSIAAAVLLILAAFVGFKWAVL